MSSSDYSVLSFPAKPRDRRQNIPKPDTGEGVTLTDFYAIMPLHGYVYVPTRELWPAASINSRLDPIPLFDKNGAPVLDKKGKPKFISPSLWFDEHRPVEQMTWVPGREVIIRDQIIHEGGLITRKGVSIFNLYRPPILELGDATKAERWLELGRVLFAEDFHHIIKWMAQRVQQPHIKINHALVFGGDQGIGKDSLIEPLKQCIGPWNFREVRPTAILGRFNPYVKSVVLRINEARDLGEFDRFAFYDRTKDLIAAPPDVLVCDEKNLREHSVPNVSGVIIGTNYKQSGIYLPADDRRHHVAWSMRQRTDYDEQYWTKLYHWYEKEHGFEHVHAYLANYNLTGFDPKAPPPKTAAWYDIVDANISSEHGELADILDALGWPKAVTIDSIASQSQCNPINNFSFADWLRDRKNSRLIPHRLETAGYAKVRNPGASDGQWKVGGKRQAVYAQKTLSLREQIDEAKKL
jgi:hypothetical protein